MIKTWQERTLSFPAETETVSRITMALMQAEIDELRARYDSVNKCASDLSRGCAKLQDERDKLKAELAALKNQEPLFERGEIGLLNELLKVEHAPLYLAPGAQPKNGS